MVTTASSELWTDAVSAPILALKLLGGFSVERDGVPIPESAWQQRRAAKHLLKLLALTPNHILHREEVVDKLWADDDTPVALKKLTKALHVARRALEPELPVRGPSSYLRFQDDVLSLEPDSIHIDVSQFRTLAERALRSGSVADCETAILAYRGELLPEDRYEDWASGYRQMLTDLLIEVYLAAADGYERREAFTEAIQRLRHAERLDPLREDVHRHLMRLYARMGKRHQALRQYQVCRDVLDRELQVAPGPETEQIHTEIVEGRFPQPQSPVRSEAPEPPSEPTSLIGRDRVLRNLMDQFRRAKLGHGGTIFISGEIGVGKTRVVAEMIQRARDDGAVIMRGLGFSLDSTPVRYEPLVQALDAHVADLPLHQRLEIASRNSELAWLVPSLATAYAQTGNGPIPVPDSVHLFAAIARFLTEASASRPLVLALRDLHAVDSSTVKLLEYLTHVAMERKWLLVGTYREEDIPADSLLPSFLLSVAREGLSSNIELHRLARQDCDELVRRSLKDGGVDAALLAYVYEMSLGNPLFTQQLIDTLVEVGQATLVEGTWRMNLESPVQVPREVRNLVAIRIGQLDRDVQRVLQMAALAGPTFAFGQLREGARAFGEPISEAALLHALDRALEARLLEECEQGYTFCHPMFQAALSEHLSRHRREQLRAALDVARVVHDRSAESVESDDDGTSEDMRRALLPREAAGKYGRQVDTLDSRGLPAESAAARQKLAAALIAMGRYERALQVLHQAERIYSDLGDNDGHARVVAQIELLSFVSPE